MHNESGWAYVAALGGLILLAGLEVGSGKGILWKRGSRGPFRTGVGAMLVLIGIVTVAFAIVLRFPPR